MMESKKINVPEIIHPHSLITRYAKFVFTDLKNEILVQLEIINKNTLTTVKRKETTISKLKLTPDIQEIYLDETTHLESDQQIDFKKLLVDIIRLGYTLIESENINNGFFIDKESLI